MHAMPCEIGVEVLDWVVLTGLACLGCKQSGKTKFTIENATKTRVVLAETRIHILGSYQNIRIARWASFLMSVPPFVSAASIVGSLNNWTSFFHLQHC